MNIALFEELSKKSPALASFQRTHFAIYKTFETIEDAAACIDRLCEELGLSKKLAPNSCAVVRLKEAGIKVNPRTPRQKPGYDVSIYPDADGDQGRFLYLSLSVIL